MGNKRNRNVRDGARVTDRPTGRDRAGAPIGAQGHADGRAGIVVHSNAPFANTGYGVQAGAFAKACKDDGRQIVFSCNYGLQGGVTSWDGIEVLPTGYHPYSSDVLGAHTEHARQTTGLPTALVTLFDCWVYKGAKVDDIPLIASWVPVDHVPTPPDVLEWCNRPNVLPVAMSKFGLDQLTRSGVDARYAPHGVDTETFRPDATVDGRTGRQILEIDEDKFVVGIVAANKGVAPLRKAWGENLLALSEFMARHDNVMAYIHTEKRGAGGGVDLVKLAESAGIPADRLIWVDQWAYYAGLGADILATIMAAFDVNLACSRGEGFGVPVIEAAACGVPSIVSNFTAQPELVDGFGWTCTVQPYWDPQQAAWFATPLVHSIVEQLEHAYTDAQDPQRRSDARAHALAYDHRTVFAEHWQPILAEIDSRMAGPLETP